MTPDRRGPAGSWGTLVPLALPAAVAILAIVLASRGDYGSSEADASALVAQDVAVPGHPTRVAVAAGRVWTLELRTRLLQIIEESSGEQVADPVRMGSQGDVVVDLDADGSGAWVALAASGGGRGVIVHVDPEGRTRVRGTSSSAPLRIVRLPSRTAILGNGRLDVLRDAGTRVWSRPLANGVDMAVGYGSVWTLSRTDAGSLVTRWAPASGRVIGRRRVDGPATAIAVGASFRGTRYARGASRVVQRSTSGCPNSWSLATSPTET